jgi:hypothetical protein
MKKQFLLLAMPFILFACSNNKTIATGDIPTKEDVTAIMKQAYEITTTAKDVFGIEINDIKIGNSQTATIKMEVNGIPRGATVTDVQVDYNITGNIESHKISKLWVYKNEFGDWKFKTGSVE